MMRLLISGGPGSGCTATARAISERLGLPVFDSDSYFHKPTDPPFQQQYSPAERRTLLESALRSHSSWILCGSVATWGLDSLEPTHGVFLSMPKNVRLQRLANRQRKQFGGRIEAGGDLDQEHRSFMEWAAEYEARTGLGRNLQTDHAFLKDHCERFLELTQEGTLEEIASKVAGFLSGRSPLSKWALFLQWVDGHLMGYDVFISYKWRTGRDYAENLAKQLSEKKYRCFLDSNELPTGSDLREDVRLAAHFSRALVVVATTDALASAHVRYEIRLFDNEVKQIVPLDVGDALYVTEHLADGSLTYLKSPNFQAILASALPAERVEMEQTFALIARDRRLQIDEYDSRSPSEDTIKNLCRRFDFTRRVHRRQRLITAACVILIGLFLEVLWSSAEANKQRIRAEASLTDALKVANVVTEQVDKKLNDIPGAEMVRENLLNPAYTMLEELLSRAPDNLSVREERARISMNLGEWHFRNRSLETARENFARSAQIYRDAGKPRSEHVVALLSLARTERELTKYEVADQIFDEALRRAKQLKDPDLVQTHQAAVLYGKADIRSDTARLPESLAMHQEAQAIRRGIVARSKEVDESFPERLLDLGASVDRVGHVAWLLKNKTVQQAAREENYAIATRLSQMRPQNGQYLRSLALAAERLGYDAMEAGNYPTAGKYLGENESVLKDLVQRAPDSKTYRYDWAIALSDLGDLRAREKRFPEAKQFYGTALGEMEKVLKLDPSSAVYFGQKILTINACGEMEVAEDHAAEALVYYAEALKLTEDAIGRWPDIPNQHLAKALILSAMSKAIAPQSSEKSLKWARDAQEILTQLVANHPTDERYKAALDALLQSHGTKQ